MVILAFELYTLVAFNSFCIVSGIIYPLNLILKVPLTNLSLPADNSVAVGKCQL